MDSIFRIYYSSKFQSGKRSGCISPAPKLTEKQPPIAYRSENWSTRVERRLIRCLGYVRLIMIPTHKRRQHQMRRIRDRLPPQSFVPPTTCRRQRQRKCLQQRGSGNMSEIVSRNDVECVGLIHRAGVHHCTSWTGGVVSLIASNVVIVSVSYSRCPERSCPHNWFFM